MTRKILHLHNAILRALQRRSDESKTFSFAREFLAFGYKEAISCIFSVFIFGILALSRIFTVPGLPRYDLLLLACIGMQWFLYRVGLETIHEVYVICIFHLLGVSMEIFKVSHGAWGYPDFGYSKILGVPLYSGFMYASVASYVCQAWRNFNLRFVVWPSQPLSVSFAILIYGNFYTNVYTHDLRLLILPLLAVGFWRTQVLFDTNGITRRMPMLLSFTLVAFFIWLAENIGTFLGAWRYPHQQQGWSVVKLQIMSSWFLLVIVSVIIVAVLKHYKDHHANIAELPLNHSS